MGVSSLLVLHQPSMVRVFIGIAPEMNAPTVIGACAGLALDERNLGALNADTRHQSLLIEDKRIGILLQRRTR
ncbi:hypothetical protein D3C79_1031880 [compost metagenome]